MATDSTLQKIADNLLAQFDKTLLDNSTDFSSCDQILNAAPSEHKGGLESLYCDLLLDALISGYYRYSEMDTKQLVDDPLYTKFKKMVYGLDRSDPYNLLYYAIIDLVSGKKENVLQYLSAYLDEKIKSLKASAHPAAQQVAESESRIAALKVQKRELLEAINAGKTALHTVNEVLETLDNAEGWSTWDVMGGGLMADLAKYEELDDAQKQIEQLQVELRRFKTELADVEITADLQVTVDSFLKFADFFFDGLFADWAVLDHINQAQSRVENTKGQIKRVLALLKKMREDVDTQIADEKEKQEQLAVETEL